jgi:hypothetical protein
MTESFMTMTECERLHRDDKEWKDQVVKSLAELNNRLYRDNGHLSIQTRLDRGDRILGVLCWVTTVAGGAIILAAVTFVIKLVVLHAGA